MANESKTRKDNQKSKQGMDTMIIYISLLLAGLRRFVSSMMLCRHRCSVSIFLIAFDFHVIQPKIFILLPRPLVGLDLHVWIMIWCV